VPKVSGLNRFFGSTKGGIEHGASLPIRYHAPEIE